MSWLDQVQWDAQGLVPVIAQEQSSGDVVMFAWMNREALQKTAEAHPVVDEPQQAVVQGRRVGP